MFGEGSCGVWFDDSNRDPKLHMGQLQVWYDSGCVMGLRTVLSGGAAGAGVARENVYGEQKGEAQTLKLEGDEFITDVDIKVGK